jgi:hypothetical protein
MDIESQRSVRVKLHWGKLKLEFDFDRLEGVDELKGSLNLRQPSCIR